MSISLTPRLSLIASCVRQGCRVADIGTDHAYIPVYLVKNGISPFAYACDIGKGPLFNAKSTVLAENAQDKVKLVLSDGLDGLENGCAEDIIIAGMGGEIIADIIRRAEWLMNNRFRLILQPMTMHHVLRKALNDMGFSPLGDMYCMEGKRFYTVMPYMFTDEKLCSDSAFFYCGTAFESTSPLAHEYINRQKQKLASQLDGMKNSQHDTSADIIRVSEILTSIEKAERNVKVWQP